MVDAHPTPIVLELLRDPPAEVRRAGPQVPAWLIRQAQAECLADAAELAIEARATDGLDVLEMLHDAETRLGIGPDSTE